MINTLSNFKDGVASRSNPLREASRLPSFPSPFQPFSFFPMFILNENPVPIRDRMPGLEKNLAAMIDKALV